MTHKEKSSNKDLTKNILNKMPSIGKRHHNFILEVFGLLLSIKGRVNFLSLARYGKREEQHYRSRFNKDFDYLNFNIQLAHDHGSGDFTIAFDPSYVSKSGKKTPGVRYFWSGSAARAKWGLQVSGIAVVDIKEHTALHLEAVQTPSELRNTSLVDHYGDLLVERKQQLLSLSKHVVSDAYFSKFGFVSKLVDNGFELTSRFRDDADLRYKYLGVQKKGRGRPKKYDGKVKYNALDPDHFKSLEDNETCKIY